MFNILATQQKGIGHLPCHSLSLGIQEGSTVLNWGRCSLISFKGKMQMASRERIPHSEAVAVVGIGRMSITEPGNSVCRVIGAF